MKIELTKQQVSNLLVFLNRVSLQGSEATILMDIVAPLQKALQDVPIDIPVKETQKTQGDKE